MISVEKIFETGSYSKISNIITTSNGDLIYCNDSTAYRYNGISINIIATFTSLFDVEKDRLVIDSKETLFYIDSYNKILTNTKTMEKVKKIDYYKEIVFFNNEIIITNYEHLLASPYLYYYLGDNRTNDNRINIYNYIEVISNTENKRISRDIYHICKYSPNYIAICPKTKNIYFICDCTKNVIFNFNFKTTKTEKIPFNKDMNASYMLIDNEEKYLYITPVYEKYGGYFLHIINLITKEIKSIDFNSSIIVNSSKFRRIKFKHIGFDKDNNPLVFISSDIYKLIFEKIVNDMVYNKITNKMTNDMISLNGKKGSNEILISIKNASFSIHNEFISIRLNKSNLSFFNL